MNKQGRQGLLMFLYGYIRQERRGGIRFARQDVLCRRRDEHKIRNEETNVLKSY